MGKEAACPSEQISKVYLGYPIISDWGIGSFGIPKPHIFG
jgi:hypothetical protein